MSEAIHNVAAMLREAADSRTPIAPVAPLLPAGDLDAAYAVQEVNTVAALAAGRRLVGRKIGLTSAAVQRQLGVDRPDYGMLFADMGYDDRASSRASRRRWRWCSAPISPPSATASPM